MAPEFDRSVRFQLDPWGRLLLQQDARSPGAPVQPVRMFPISDPNHWVALCDPAGRELLCIEDLALLPPASRRLLENELASREFIPVIERVHGVSSLSEPCEWDVETDRGRTKFVLQAEDDVHRLSPTCAIFIDSHGTRYLVRDVRQLDPVSRRYVEWYV